MPKRKNKTNKTNKINKTRNKGRKTRRYRIKGGTRPSVSCEQSGSVDHNPPQWNSTIMGGSHDINDELYNQYTDMTPYSISQ